MTAAPDPSYDEVLMLPAALERVVPAEHGDANGHMNVRHHLALHDDAGWAFFAAAGFDPAYITERKRNFFDVEHHLRYLDEVLVGDAVSVHPRVLGRTAKVVHVVSYLLDRTRGTLAGTLELLTVHVDLTTRRSVALHGPEAEAIDALVAEHAALPWVPRLSGAFTLRG